MDSFEFNNVKDEKAQAIRSYYRRKLLKKLELFTALALLVWSSYYNYIPVVAAAAAKIPADFLLRNVAVLGQPLHVFLAINILIVVISFLPSQKPTKQDLYDYIITIINSSRRISTAADDHKPAPEVPVSDKQIVCVGNVMNPPPAEQNTVGAALAKSVKESEPVSPVQESTVGEVKEYYRRSRSERLDRGKENGRELMRRSETLIKRTTSEGKEGWRRSSDMDDMSSEEFKKTIDIFIAAKKKTLIKENTVDINLCKKTESDSSLIK